MGAGQSTPLCDFSEEQISILQKESEQIFELITILKNKDEYDTQIGVINRRLLRSESPLIFHFITLCLICAQTILTTNTNF
jgi:hypothetical protein